MKKTIGYIMIILLFAGTIGAIVLGVMYLNLNNYLVDNDITVEYVYELEQSYNKLSDKNLQLQFQIDTLLKEDANNKEQIANYQKEIDRLKGLLSQSDIDKSKLQSEINSLKTAKTQLEEDNKKLENTISTLKADKIELQNQITDLQAQLKAYEDMNLTDYYKLEFVNSSTDLVVSSLYLKEGSSFEIPTIEQTKDTWFYGWSTIENSGVVFDFSNFEVDNDYTFYSVLGETVPVRFNDNEYCYYFGKNLTIRDILVFDNRVDLSDENLELSLTNNVSLDTAITSLPTKMYSLGSGIYTKPEYVLDVQINFNFNKAPSVYFFEEGDTTMAVETIEGLDKYSVNFLSLKNLNFTLTSDKEGFTDTIEFSNFQNNEGKVFSNRIEYSTTGSFAGYNFAITFGNFFTRNGYGFNINFETVPSGINNIKLINCSFKYELESSYITLLSGAFGAEVPDARV